MKTKLQMFLAMMVAFAAPPLLATDEEDLVHKSAMIMQRFKSMPESQIPRQVLRDAKGLAILTVVKGGFIWSGKVGNGVVVSRLGKTWSGPSFIRTGGAGFGAQIGAQVTEFVLVLNTREAVDAFSAGTNVSLGGALSVAAGPVGRSAEAAVMPRAAIYTYSLSKGLFAGVSLEGSVMSTNKKANERYYHSTASADSILRGRIAPPRSAMELLAKL